MLTILLIILLLALLGAFPAWPYSAGWGYYPSGTLGLTREPTPFIRTSCVQDTDP